MVFSLSSLCQPFFTEELMHQPRSSHTRYLHLHLPLDSSHINRRLFLSSSFPSPPPFLSSRYLSFLLVFDDDHTLLVFSLSPSLVALLFEDSSSSSSSSFTLSQHLCISSSSSSIFGTPLSPPPSLTPTPFANTDDAIR